MWTSPLGQYYYYVTTHWIDDSWVIQKQMEVDHIGWNIYQVISETLKFFFCYDKVFSITFDNASNNDVVTETLKESLEFVRDATFFHI